MLQHYLDEDNNLNGGDSPKKEKVQLLPPNNTLYINNINEKIPIDGKKNKFYFPMRSILLHYLCFHQFFFNGKKRDLVKKNQNHLK